MLYFEREPGAWSLKIYLIPENKNMRFTSLEMLCSNLGSAKLGLEDTQVCRFVFGRTSRRETINQNPFYFVANLRSPTRNIDTSERIPILALQPLREALHLGD
jgi:hypothetical protein